MKKIFLLLLVSLGLFLSLPLCDIVFAQSQQQPAQQPAIPTATDTIRQQPAALPTEFTVTVTDALKKITLINQSDSIITYKLGTTPYTWGKGEELILTLNRDTVTKDCNFAFADQSGAQIYSLTDEGLGLWAKILIAIIGLIALFIAIISFSPNKNQTPVGAIGNQINRSSDNPPVFPLFSLLDPDYSEYKWLYQAVMVQHIIDHDVINFYNVLHFVVNSLNQMDNPELVGHLYNKAEKLKEYPINPALAEFMRCKCKEHNAQTLKEYFSQKQDPLCDLYICIAKKATPQNELWYLFELIEASLDRIGLDTYFNQIDKKSLPAPTLHQV